MGTVAQEQILPDLNSHFSQTFDLSDKRYGIDDDTVTDHTDFSAPKDARRNEMKNVCLAAMNNGVTGVIATLTAHNDVSLCRQDIDDLAFSLVSPLSANQDRVRHVLADGKSLKRAVQRRLDFRN